MQYRFVAYGKQLQLYGPPGEPSLVTVNYVRFHEREAVRILNSETLEHPGARLLGTFLMRYTSIFSDYPI